MSLSDEIVVRAGGLYRRMLGVYLRVKEGGVMTKYFRCRLAAPVGGAVEFFQLGSLRVFPSIAYYPPHQHEPGTGFDSYEEFLVEEVGGVRRCVACQQHVSRRVGCRDGDVYGWSKKDAFSRPFWKSDLPTFVDCRNNVLQLESLLGGFCEISAEEAARILDRVGEPVRF